MLRPEETKTLPMRPAGKEAGMSESKTGFGVSKGPLPPQRAQQGKESS